MATNAVTERQPKSLRPPKELLSLGSCMPHRLLIIVLASCLTAHAQKPIGEVRAKDASLKGSVVLGKDGAVLMSGSQVQAGTVSAEIELARGGKVQVCPGSAVSVSASASGEELMFAISGGAIETHYKLPARSDAILTPDFRIQLSGPGAFHLAVNIKKNGDTCVESMNGDTSAVILTETFGEGTYQIQPGKNVTFHNGHVDGVTENPTSSCGCPPPAAVAPPPEFDPGLNFPKEESERAAKNASEGKPVEVPTTPVTQAQSGKVYAKIDAPMVFDANTPPPPVPKQPETAVAAPPMPDPYPKVVSPTVTPKDAQTAAPVQPTSSATPPTKEAPKKKWYQRVGSAIAKFFKPDATDKKTE